MFKKKVPVKAGSTLDNAIRHCLETGKQFMYNQQAVSIDKLEGNPSTRYFLTMSRNTEFKEELR